MEKENDLEEPLPAPSSSHPLSRGAAVSPPASGDRIFRTLEDDDGAESSAFHSRSLPERSDHGGQAAKIPGNEEDVAKPTMANAMTSERNFQHQTNAMEKQGKNEDHQNHDPNVRSDLSCSDRDDGRGDGDIAMLTAQEHVQATATKPTLQDILLAPGTTRVGRGEQIDVEDNRIRLLVGLEDGSDDFDNKQDCSKKNNGDVEEEKLLKKKVAKFTEKEILLGEEQESETTTTSWDADIHDDGSTTKKEKHWLRSSPASEELLPLTVTSTACTTSSDDQNGGDNMASNTSHQNIPGQDDSARITEAHDQHQSRSHPPINAQQVQQEDSGAELAHLMAGAWRVYDAGDGPILVRRPNSDISDGGENSGPEEQDAPDDHEDEEGLVAASPVGTSFDPDKVVIAHPRSWIRKNQRWLAGSAVISLLAIIIPTVVTTVKPPSSQQVLMDMPTSAPTTLAMSIQDALKDIIVSRFASTEPALSDESTPQSKALSWLTEAAFIRNQSSSLSSMMGDETKILQQFTLATLFLSSGGGDSSSWLNSTGWLMNTDECTWFGVICHPTSSNAISPSSGTAMHGTDESPVVTSLSLSGNGLNGTIPPDVSILSNSLSDLDLFGNHLFGSVPSEIGLMTMLSSLSLGSNDLVGSIPSEIGSLTNLVALDISDNLLSLRIPSQVGRMTMLASMNLGDNNLSGSVPRQVGRMTNLEQLILKSNSLTFTLPSEIGVLARLEELNLDDNSILGPMPSEIGLLRRLKILNMARNRVFGTLPRELQFLSNHLEHLDWSSNLLTGSIPSLLGRFSKLAVFNLDDNFLSGSIPALELMTHLLVLRLKDNQLVGSLSDITSASLLELDVSRNRLRGSLPDMNSTSLRYLDVSDNVLDGPLPDIASTLLLHLDASGNRLTGQIPPNYFKLTHLTRLGLADNSIARSAFPESLGFLSRLTHLDLGGCSISGTISDSIDLLTDLKELSLRRNFIQGKIPNFGSFGLERLDLGSNFLLGTIPPLFVLMTALEWINLGSNLIYGTIGSNLESLTNLRYLDLSSNEISGAIPSQFESFTSLEHLDLALNHISGWIPTFSLTNLEHLDLSFNDISGTIPSVLGSLSRLQVLNLSFNLQIWGTIPSYLGKLSRLEQLELSFNMISGTIPKDLGSLSGLEVLFLYINRLSGTIPSTFRFLRRLGGFRLRSNLMTGAVPSYLGLLTRLTWLDLADNSFGGTLPSQLGSLAVLKYMHLHSNELSGTIPSHFGLLASLNELSLEDNNVTGTIPLCGVVSHLDITVDCEEVACSCCHSCPTPVPSQVPSVSALPTQGPTESAAPSVSMLPTTLYSCTPFHSIHATGRLLDISSLDDGTEFVNLPFSFVWRGQVEYNHVAVTTNGVIWPGNTNPDYGCCSVSPVELGGRYQGPRIAVAQEDLDPSRNNGSIYVGLVEPHDTFVVSWEGVAHWGALENENRLFFQAALHPDGTVELRWGEEARPRRQIAAGLEEDTENVVAPATGWPFGDGGVTEEWPTNQCRTFVPVNGSYTELQPM